MSPPPASPPPAVSVSVSVVLPAFREGSTVFLALERLLDALDSIGRSFEVLVVSDGSDDDTVAQAERHEGVRVIAYGQHRGKGNALRVGAAESTGRAVVFIDADLDLDPAGIGGLVELLDAGADAAVGSKRHPQSQVSYPALRRLQSAAYQRLIRLLFDLDLTDTQTGLKAFRGDILREVSAGVASDGFAFDLELLAALRDRGCTIAEGPVRLDFQFSSTTNVRATIEVLRDTFRIARARRRGRRPQAVRRSRRQVT